MGRKYAIKVVREAADHDPTLEQEPVSLDAEVTTREELARGSGATRSRCSMPRRQRRRCFVAERILLVTGARALADTAEAEAWAKEQLRDFVSRAWWGKRPTLVVAGDATGPDTHAIDYARLLRIDYAQWCLDGWIGGSLPRPWWPAGTARPRARRWPLERNARMVAAVAERAAAGDTARALALTAPWARTQGTMHTVARAREAGLVVEVRACPADLGPREASRADR